MEKRSGANHSLNIVWDYLFPKLLNKLLGFSYQFVNELLDLDDFV